eukprot:1193806-Prorocentrum_minimum.AAC.2
MITRASEARAHRLMASSRHMSHPGRLRHRTAVVPCDLWGQPHNHCGSKSGIHGQQTPNICRREERQ